MIDVCLFVFVYSYLFIDCCCVCELCCCCCVLLGALCVVCVVCGVDPPLCVLWLRVGCARLVVCGWVGVP